MEGRQLWVLGLPCCCSWHTLKPVVRLPLEQKGTPSYFTHVSCFKGLKTAEAWHTSRHRVIWQPHTCWTWTAWHLQIPLFSFQLLTVKIVYVRLFSICILSGWSGAAPACILPKQLWPGAGQWLHPWLLPGLEFAVFLWDAVVTAVTLCPVSPGICMPLCVER